MYSCLGYYTKYIGVCTLDDTCEHTILKTSLRPQPYGPSHRPYLFRVRRVPEEKDTKLWDPSIVETKSAERWRIR
jgi:hypothetical protein